MEPNDLDLPIPTTRRSRLVGILLSPLGVSVATLLLHVLVAGWFDLPGAFGKYNLAAQQYLNGELLSERLFDFSPLLLYLSVGAEALFSDPQAVLEGLQILLSAVSAGLFFALLRLRFSVGLSAAAVLAFALDRHLLVYQRIVEPDVYLLAFVVACLFFLKRAHRREDDVASPWIAGGFAALCTLIRPTFVPLILLLPFYLKPRGTTARRLWLARSAGALLPVVVVVLALMARAAVVTGDPRTPVMNPGSVFFEGNNPISRGTSAVYPPLVLKLYGSRSSQNPDSPHIYYRTLARAATGRPLSISEANAYWTEKTLRYVRAEPGRFLGLLREKLLNAFHGYRWHDILSAWHYDRMLRVPAVPFALVTALALSGLLLEVREWRQSILYYALACAQLGVMFVFYVSARQRLVLLPALLYFAAVSVERIVRLGRRSLLLLALIGVLTLSFLLPTEAIRDEEYRRDGYVAAEPMLREIRARSAAGEPLAWNVDLAAAAIGYTPWWIDLMRPAHFPQDDASLEERVAEALRGRGESGVSHDFDLGVLWLEAGRLDEAERLLAPLADAGREVYRDAGQPSDPLFFLARTAALGGHRERAVERLQEALERSPGHPYVLAELVALTGDTAYEAPLFDFSNELDARYLLGQAFLRYGRGEEAVEAFDFVVRRVPELREGRIHLAAALAACGRIDEGAERYLEVVREQPEPILLSLHIVPLFRRWMALHPNRPQVQFLGARVLYLHGRLREALEVLEGLEAPAALRQRVEEEKARIRRALAPPGEAH